MVANGGAVAIGPDAAARTSVHSGISPNGVARISSHAIPGVAATKANGAVRMPSFATRPSSASMWV